MKRFVVVTLLFMLISTFVFAQVETTENREKSQIGVKAGLSYSNVYDSEGNEFDSDAKYGLHFGAFLKVPIGKSLGIQPEILFTQKGFKGSGKLLGSSYNFKRTTTFIEIPVLVAFKPSEFITVLVGPQLSFLTKEKYVFTSSALSYSQEQEFKQDDIQKNILGFVFGIEFNLKHLLLSARTGWDILRNKDDGSSETPRYKNVSTLLTIGYSFY